VNGPVFTGEMLDLVGARQTYVELPQTLVKALQKWPSYSFTGWVNFKSVRAVNEGMTGSMPIIRASRSRPSRAMGD
jgi:hypothetical protein